MTETGMHTGENAKRRRALLALAIFLLLLLLAVPALCRYQPPLIGVTGYETHLVTDPGYFGSLNRALQIVLVPEVIPCTYRLHGWDEEERLYYSAICFGREAQWQYEPDRQRRQRVDVVPAALHVEDADRDDVLDRVRAAGVRPVSYEPSTRPILLNDPGLVSASGRYTAIITQRHYSIYDVVVLEKEGG